MTTLRRASAMIMYRTTVVLTIVVGVVFAYGMADIVRALGGADMTALILGVVLGATALILVITMVAMWPGRYIRDIARMRAGDATAHWTYSRPEWRAANRLEARRIRWGLFTWTLMGLIGAGAATVLGRVIEDPRAAEALGRLGVVLLILTVAGTVVVTGLSGPVLARTRRRGEVYISPYGIYHRPGGYRPFFSFGHVLRDVELGDEPRLHLRFLARAQNTAGDAGQLWATVAVPAGREGEARELVEGLLAAITEHRERPEPEYSGRGGVLSYFDISWWH
jgi:hypothetical protein